MIYMDKTLKYSLLISCSGLVILYMISLNISLPNKGICDISLDDFEQKVGITGEVTKIYAGEASTSVYLDNCTKNYVIVFEKINLSIGDRVDIVGKVDDYNNKTSIMAERIIII